MITSKHPLIIFLHGTGERGNGTTELPMVEYFGIPSITKNGLLKSGNTSFIVLSPQLGKQFGEWPAWIIDEMVKYSKTLNIDTTQTYLTGLSLGGSAVVQYPITHPGVFTALAPVCPACIYDYQNTKKITEPHGDLLPAAMR
jgi:predicted peptidase